MFKHMDNRQQEMSHKDREILEWECFNIGAERLKNIMLENTPERINIDGQAIFEIIRKNIR